MTAGMAFEALNNAGAMDADLLVILNDNDMSISPPVGALNQLPGAADVGALLRRRAQAREREGAASAAAGAGSSPSAPRSTSRAWSRPARCSRNSASTTSARSTATTSTRWSPTLAQHPQARRARSSCTWSRARGRATSSPRTTRSLYHGVEQVRPGRGHQAAGRAGQADLHAGLRRLAVRHGGAGRAPGRHHAGDARRLGLVRFAEEFPDRYFDVGIAEQHAVTFAAGLACEGLKPVVAIYSTFLQRAYDQLIHDVAHPEPAGDVRARPRRPGRRRRRHAPRRLRSLLPALHAQHDGHGAGRRERMPADAVHRHSGSTARRRCAIRAAAARASRCSRS